MQKYSQIGRLLQQSLQQRSSLKTIVLKSSQNPQFIRQAYALVSKAIDNYDKLMEIVDELLAKQYFEIYDKNLLIVLMLDLYNPENRKKKKIGGQLCKYLKQNAEFIQSRLLEYKIFEQIQRFIHIRSNTELPFLCKQDNHIPDLYQADYADYSQYLANNPEFRQNNTYIVQSKSSALPAYLLLRNLFNKNCDIVDCCAAPGNKTIQLSQYSKQHNINGQIFAFEKDPKRFEILKSRLIKYNCENVMPQNMDFLTININDYKKVKLALLDPSCSGSGMLQQRQVEGMKDIDIIVPNAKVGQVQNLAHMQGQMLNQLASFKNLRLIIYSTCSIYKEENEDVANNFIKQHPNWQAVHLFPEWQDRGIDSQNYVRVKPGESDGFFIAMFKRKKQ